MKTPTKVNYMDLISTCVSCDKNHWDEYMKGTTKADGKQIRRLIKKHLSELYDDLCLHYHNPYEHKCRKKKGLLIYVHSMIEYFIAYN